MGNFLVKHFADSMLSQMKKLSDSMNESIQSFEWDDFDKAFENAEKSLNKSMKKLNKRFKNTKDSLTINIPYDRNTDTLTTTIDNNTFKAVVKTESENGSSEKETSIYLDETVDKDSVTRKYDAEKNLMYFTFKKFNAD